MQTIALVLFIITYVLMIALSEKRPYVALISAILYVALGIMPVGQIVHEIDWNVLMMLAGTMGTVFLFIESKMPNRLADLLLKRPPTSCGWLWLCLCSPVSFLLSWTTWLPS